MQAGLHKRNQQALAVKELCSMITCVQPQMCMPDYTAAVVGACRNPFGTTTDAGCYLSLNTRVFERTVDVRR
jgi:hypothetical protein